MGFALVVAGLLMVVTGARGTYASFGQQVASDFTGPNNFTYWLVGIGSVGAIGYIDSLKTFSRLFMTLVIISMLLSNKGFFAKFTEALKTGPVAPQAPGSNATPSAAGSSANSVGVQGGPSLKQSLQKPGGGGFWDYFGIPSPF
jgi:hypothetical protein